MTIRKSAQDDKRRAQNDKRWFRINSALGTCAAIGESRAADLNDGGLRYSLQRRLLLTAFKRRKSEERDLRYIAKLFAPCWRAALRRVRQTRQVM